MMAAPRLAGLCLVLAALFATPFQACAQELAPPTAPSVELPPDVRTRLDAEFETLLQIRAAAMVQTAMASQMCERVDPAPAGWCERMGGEAEQARSDYEAARQAYERNHARALGAARAQPLWREIREAADLRL